MSDVMVYVQHLLGIGHVRRMALINQAMRDQGLTVTVASGGIPDPSLDFAADHVVQLTACRSADSNFSGLVDVNDAPVDDEWKERRKADLLASLAVSPLDEGGSTAKFDSSPPHRSSRNAAPVLRRCGDPRRGR